ncbi:hypothetical protein BDV33DRAFT_174632 [Aspergillus novoparasiticus]|uniref:Uncharacterized protein n=1 Tax=Aspergillus novoparasiticus TaxID=986946 RepID=A0A5N6EMM6_9EURO|nr:hypothetical protein BDV33DRAFT_174632 [Aspergillus novoparasiticus]
MTAPICQRHASTVNVKSWRGYKTSRSAPTVSATTMSSRVQSLSLRTNVRGDSDSIAIHGAPTSGLACRRSRCPVHLE